MSKKQSEKLGMSYGKAVHRLRKMILFDLIKKLNLDNCYRCNEKIKNIKDLSIEHKTAWLNSENPQESFFNLENIAFSHLSCNSSFSDKSYCNTKFWRNKMSKINEGCNSTKVKLNDSQVLEIRKLLDIDDTLRNIARQYNVHHTQILRIKHNISWGHV